MESCEEDMKCVRGKFAYCSTEAMEKVGKRKKSSREICEKLKKVLEDLSKKAPDGSANNHDAHLVFKHCHDSLKHGRRGTRRHLIEANGYDWEDSPERHSTARILRKDLSDWTSDLVADFNNRCGTNYATIF